MKLIAVSLVVACLLLAGLCGCKGVFLDSAHAQTLAKSTAWAQSASGMADANQLDAPTMKAALHIESQMWAQFLYASQGKDSNGN
jgi:hypothetical protein